MKFGHSRFIQSCHFHRLCLVSQDGLLLVFNSYAFPCLDPADHAKALARILVMLPNERGLLRITAVLPLKNFTQQIPESPLHDVRRASCIR